MVTPWRSEAKIITDNLYNAHDISKNSVVNNTYESVPVYQIRNVPI